MLELIKKMIEDKKEYKQQMARVETLPEDYRFVFKKSRDTCGDSRGETALTC